MSDSISRADAIDAVHKYFVNEFNNEPHEIDEDGDDVFTDMKSVNALLHHNKMVSKALKALPSADAKWIPCSERLPSESDYYLVTNINAFGEKEVCVIWFAHKIDYGISEWREITDEDTILAWMPLPKSYGEGGEA